MRLFIAASSASSCRILLYRDRVQSIAHRLPTARRRAGRPRRASARPSSLPWQTYGEDAACGSRRYLAGSCLCLEALCIAPFRALLVISCYRLFRQCVCAAAAGTQAKSSRVMIRQGEPQRHRSLDRLVRGVPFHLCRATALPCRDRLKDTQRRDRADHQTALSSQCPSNYPGVADGLPAIELCQWRNHGVAVSRNLHGVRTIEDNSSSSSAHYSAGLSR